MTHDQHDQHDQAVSPYEVRLTLRRLARLQHKYSPEQSRDDHGRFGEGGGGGGGGSGTPSGGRPHREVTAVVDGSRQVFRIQAGTHQEAPDFIHRLNPSSQQPHA